MASSLALNNPYEKHINDKLDRSKSPISRDNGYIQSDKFSHKQKKQIFLEGSDQRMMFSDSNLQTQNTTQDDVDAIAVHTLDLDQIPDGVTADDLKRNLKLNHLVSMQVDTDNVKNVSTGKGKISFRSNRKNEKDRVIEKLRTLGIQSGEHQHKNNKKVDRVNTSGIGFLDSRNELDLMKGSLIERKNYEQSKASAKSVSRVKSKQKIAGKVGENLLIKPKNYLADAQNDTKEKRIVFYESNGDLFGNTNGTYSKNHTQKLTKNMSNFEKDQKDNRHQHKIIQDWTKMQKRLEKYASNRALKPKINRYGRTQEF